MNYAALLDDRFLKLVGLGERIPFEIIKDLRTENGVRMGGCAFTSENRIEICAGLNARQFLAVYMHEAAHFIATRAGIAFTIDSQCHTAYFATLVAVMYRRSKQLDNLKIYDFADDNASDPARLKSAVTVSDDALIKRFRYIVKRSADYAATSMTVEEIAADIYRRDVAPQFVSQVTKKKAAKAINWLELVLGAAFGATATTTLAAIFLLKIYP